MRPVEETCYWLATRPAREASVLAGDVRADVAIVGGGFTGLWTALFLKELDPALRVAVVEQGLVGYGATGRNAGIVGETLDHSHALAARHFGEDEARELARLGRENLDELDRFLAERGIDAEFERSGQLQLALTPAHVEGLRDAVLFAHRLGLSDWRFLSAAEAQDEIHSPLFLGAALAPKSGTLHPVKLVEGLRAEAARLGVSIFERSPVSAIARTPQGVLARTASGSLSARRLVLAANAYSHALRPALRRRYLPLYDYVLVSEPLTAADREAIGWKNRRAATDARTFFNYSRLTRDGRILWGTSEAVYYPGNRVDRACDHSPAHDAALRASFARHFPQLRPLAFPYAWGGPICSTTRLTPFFGSRRGWARSLRARLHGARHRQHARRREDPGAHGARPEESAARSRDGAEAPVSLPARAAAPLGGRSRDAEPPPRGRGGASGTVSAPPRRSRNRVFELARRGD